MPKKQPKTTAVKDRLTDKLNGTDRASITNCLLEHMVANNLQANDLGSFEELLVDLLPMLSKANKDWEGIIHERILKGTEVRRRFGDHIRNLKKEAEGLNARVTAMKIPLNLNYSDDSPDLQNQQEDQPDSKSQLSKDKNSNSSPKPINDIVSQFKPGETATGQDEQTPKPTTKKRLVKSAPELSLR